MDQLELLKQNWKQRDQEHPRLTYDQIYNMLFKRSTSIVKWIFVISLLELFFWIGLYFVSPKSSFEIIEKLGMSTIMLVFNIVHYIVVLVFIYCFYKNYRSIIVTESTKSLMQSILKTRKTVRYFVIYNVSAFILTLCIINYYYYTKSDLLLEVISDVYGMDAFPPDFLTYFFVGQIIVGIVLIVLLVLFYRLVYGILLRKLYKNYRELKKIEL